MVASSSRVLPKVPSLATFPVSSKTQNVCRRSPRSNPIVILFLLLAAVLLIRHRVYRHPQWRPTMPSHLISFHHSTAPRSDRADRGRGLPRPKAFLHCSVVVPRSESKGCSPGASASARNAPCRRGSGGGGGG